VGRVKTSREEEEVEEEVEHACIYIFEIR